MPTVIDGWLNPFRGEWRRRYKLSMPDGMVYLHDILAHSDKTIVYRASTDPSRNSEPTLIVKRMLGAATPTNEVLGEAHLNLLLHERGLEKFCESYGVCMLQHSFVTNDNGTRDGLIVFPARNGTTLLNFFRANVYTLTPAAPDVQYSHFVASVFTHLMRAVNAMHALNVVHMDLKPENIITDKETGTTLYLIDFGLSCATLDELQDGTLSSVPVYCPRRYDTTSWYKDPLSLTTRVPTDLSQRVALFKQFDIYQCGVILRLMYEPYFYRIDPARVPFSERSKPPAMPDTVWAVVREMTGALSERRPAGEYFAIAEGLERHFEVLLATGGSHATTPPAPADGGTADDMAADDARPTE